MKKIAINGFGRIGRAAFKKSLEHLDELEVVAINDLFPTKTLAYMLKYDSVYGTYNHNVSHDERNIIVDGKKYPVYAERDPDKLPWKDLEVDIVIESTGIFRTEEAMRLHIKAGAKKVMLSAPAKEGNVSTHVLGVSDIASDSNQCISSASCTTNSIGIPVKVLHHALGIKKALLTTVHGYTADQNLVDGPHKDPRRGRAAAENIIPTTTGAAKAVGLVVPEVKGKFDGIALRVPTPAGSVSDITMVVEKQTSVEEVNNILKQAVNKDEYKNIFAVTEEPLVSRDILGTSYSGIVDLQMTRVIKGDLVKILSWYDNEWGYTCRLIEAVIKLK